MAQKKIKKEKKTNKIENKKENEIKNKNKNNLNKKENEIKNKNKNKNKNKKITNNENNNENNNSGNALTKSQVFNKILSNCVKDTLLVNPASRNSSKSKFKTEAEYQASFADVIKFTDNVSKNDINVVLYHASNNDGVISAFIAWNYLVKDNNKKDVMFIGLKPSHGTGVDSRLTQHESRMKDKNVIILDLSYSNASFDYVKSIAKSLIIIDDHNDRTKYMNKDVKIFVGDGTHATVSYTYKFFYPQKPVPKYVQYIDDSDAKLHLPYISYSNFLSVSLGFRIVHNIFKKIDNSTFEELYEIFKNDNVNFLIFLGKYFEEVRDHLKNQIAINARMATFQGYRVATLNFDSPALTKPVARQIITNFSKSGHQIDFVVLWAYQYSLNPPSYHITLIDDHRQTKINMGDIAEKLGKISGHPLGSGGHAHASSFYWSKDIQSLFSKKYL